MQDDSTGSELYPVVEALNSNRSFVISSSGSVSGDAYAPDLITSGNRSTGSNPLTTSHGVKQYGKTKKVLPKLKHKCFAQLATCVDNLNRAIDNEEEFYVRNNALEQLRKTLAELWEIRSGREENFAAIVNMLQGIFEKKEVEYFTTENLKCLLQVFERFRDEVNYDDNFVGDITITLFNGGIDAFEEIR
ncbi:MAG TPA: hypothetical protein DCY03_32610 [Planctomycetaceae bacterium]|nr:hypothetical protein [Planctomycetaceae bacterium]|tara:strand:+ start:4153 stop:4722 length:570 start_codon:yes stop_codon:yes gene_type:complete